MAIPTGKGMYLRGGGLNYAQVAEYLQGAGFTWIAPFELHVSALNDPQKRKMFTRRGIAIYPCWYLKPENYREKIDDSIRASTGGIMPNPECEWKTRHPPLCEGWREGDHERLAAEMMRYARSKFSGTIGISSFSIYPPDLPQVFASADFGSPQIYDKDASAQGKANIERGLRTWREAGFSTLIPSLGAQYAKEVVRSKTAQEMAPYLNLVPAAPGVCVWPYPGLLTSPERHMELWTLLASYDAAKLPLWFDLVPLGRWAATRLLA